MKRNLGTIILFFVVLSCSQLAGQTRRALLIGINTYQPSGTRATHPAGCSYGRCELSTFQNLDGSVNDAQAMADLLTSPKFGFPSSQVVLLANPTPPHPRLGLTFLPESQTTREGILAAMQEYLVDLPKPGDTVVFYAASYGSLRVNNRGDKFTVIVKGQFVHADSTLVPSDAYQGAYDIRDSEMERIFNAALDKGIHLTVIFDSCHSSSVNQGVGPTYRGRALAFDPRDINQAPETLLGDPPHLAPTERTDNPALVLSAAGQAETANEMPIVAGTASESHGAFTSALIEALQVLPANAPSSVVYRHVTAILESEGVPDQKPYLDAPGARRLQTLFGGETASKPRADVLGRSANGFISLDIGRASGLGVGSEFTSIVQSSASAHVLLRITSIDDLARSSAEVVSPVGAEVLPGQVFELSNPVPADFRSIKVTASVLGTRDDGSILLDIGRASGLGVGSVFTLVSDVKSPNGASNTVSKSDAQNVSEHPLPSPAQYVLLEITSIDGLARSSAKVLLSNGAKVLPGEQFELSTLVPAYLHSSDIFTAALGTSGDGSILLDIGYNSGLGVGSEFTSMVLDSAGRYVVLRITSLDGLARSSAKVVSPDRAEVLPGEIFELSKWIPADLPSLRVWLWPSNLSENEVLAAAVQVKASGTVVVSDPAEEPWTHILSWDGTQWTLQEAGSSAAVSIGAPLTADALRKNLPTGARLWANFPPPRELAAKLERTTSESAVQPAENLTGAQYALTGVLTADGPAYAWFHKTELAAGPPTLHVLPHSPGCSPDSQYPVRTDWISLDDPSKIDLVGSKLNAFALRLGKAHSWLSLKESAAVEAAAEYYNLVIVRASDRKPLPRDYFARRGDALNLALASNEPVLQPRYMYVLDIDCHGQGTVLYPEDYRDHFAKNISPNDTTGGNFVVLPRPTLVIDGPYGVDTLILLSTTQPLPDPYAFNFESVASSHSRGTESPLQNLLTNASVGGTRKVEGDIPLDWGVSVSELRSVPQEATR